MVIAIRSKVNQSKHYLTGSCFKKSYSGAAVSVQNPPPAETPSVTMGLKTRAIITIRPLGGTNAEAEMSVNVQDVTTTDSSSAHDLDKD